MVRKKTIHATEDLPTSPPKKPKKAVKKTERSEILPLRPLTEADIKKGISGNDITVNRVLQELARVAFADIREALIWHDSNDETDGRRKNSVAVTLKSSEELSPDIAAAISEVVQTPSGPKIKLYDKRAALIDLGKILGIFKQDETIAPRKIISAEPLDEKEWSDRYVRN